MPAKKVVTKEIILQCALDMVRESGMEALNMRSLANRCNCSTQPIYLSFANMEELRIEVAKEVLKIFDRYIEEEIARGKYPEYKAVGMGYIKFAKAEKELFKFLLMNDGMAKSGLEKESFSSSVLMIVKNYGLYKTEAEKLHLEMWIFVHGIASMFATDYIEWDEEIVSGMVSDAFKGFTSLIKGDKND